MNDFFTRLKDAVMYFNGNHSTAAPSTSSHKEFVCYLSREDHLKMKQELIDLYFDYTSNCRFDAIPVDNTLKSNFLSVFIYGVTVHFHEGEYSFIGPVKSLQ